MGGTSGKSQGCLSHHLLAGQVLAIQRFSGLGCCQVAPRRQLSHLLSDRAPDQFGHGEPFFQQGQRDRGQSRRLRVTPDHPARDFNRQNGHRLLLPGR